MGALHQNVARYDNGNTVPPQTDCAMQVNSSNCTHPGDKWGWAVGAGMTLKMPWDARDTLSGQIAYAKGASGYVAYGQGNNWLHKTGVAVGAFNDAIFATPGTNVASGLEQTEAWGGTIAFEHYWTPSLRTSFVFGYLEVNYSDTAKAMIAGPANTCAGTGAALRNVGAGNSFNCDPDWSLWRVASRTMWNPVRNLDVGLEVAYTKLDTAFGGTAAVVGSQGVGSNTYAIQDEHVWSATFRVQRNFWP